ncbi:hypothetical protein [Ruminococcus flavefaciens]|uniref:Cthe-2314-like HEPN domain-containing protein n=1 Tax=Ruminococcus flavefaciens 007c TaxID=1341157 RepID=W7UFI1_RUMFL|nr:hypothetical protein [Ruminococcus flavefaciens]EWM53951.1 hypothetical protein RF007C_03305 [Ruminococcus flavefaciens 007c]
MSNLKRLDRDFYRSIKNMSNEEMAAFLDRQAKLAVEDYKKEHDLSIQTDEKGKYIGMSRDLFKIIHSELIQQVQTIEYNLKIIYSKVQPGDFCDNYESIEKLNLGRIIAELKKIGNEADYLTLTEEDYRLLDEIREIRNYWCHQCYIDFGYIPNNDEREAKFQEIAEKLHFDEPRTWKLSRKIENIRLYVVKKYDKKKSHR